MTIQNVKIISLLFLSSFFNFTLSFYPPANAPNGTMKHRLSEKHSWQYGYNHCSEKTASFSVRLMAGRHFDICILHFQQFAVTHLAQFLY